jgi:hypothetical protein
MRGIRRAGWLIHCSAALDRAGGHATVACTPCRFGIGRRLVSRASILRGVAEPWIVSDGSDQADAIAVLGCELDVRPLRCCRSA